MSNVLSVPSSLTLPFCRLAIFLGRFNKSLLMLFPDSAVSFFLPPVPKFFPFLQRTGRPWNFGRTSKLKTLGAAHWAHDHPCLAFWMSWMPGHSYVDFNSISLFQIWRNKCSILWFLERQMSEALSPCFLMRWSLLASKWFRIPGMAKTSKLQRSQDHQSLPTGTRCQERGRAASGLESFSELLPSSTTLLDCAEKVTWEQPPFAFFPNLDPEGTRPLWARDGTVLTEGVAISECTVGVGNSLAWDALEKELPDLTEGVAIDLSPAPDKVARKCPRVSWSHSFGTWFDPFRGPALQDNTKRLTIFSRSSHPPRKFRSKTISLPIVTILFPSDRRTTQLLRKSLYD